MTSKNVTQNFSQPPEHEEDVGKNASQVADASLINKLSQISASLQSGRLPAKEPTVDQSGKRRTVFQTPQVRTTRRNVKMGLTRLLSPGSSRSRRKKKKKSKKAGEEGENQKDQTEVEEDDASESQKADDSRRSLNEELTHVGWEGVPGGKGLFYNKRLEAVWLKNEVRSKLPVSDPQQLLKLGPNMLGRPMTDEVYTPGEGFIIHCVAGFFKKLPTIGYHAGTIKAIHSIAREKMGLDPDENAQVMADVATLKEVKLKHIAYKLSDYILPKGSTSSRVLTDIVNSSDICDKIDDLASADAEMYQCYVAIGQMLELNPDDRVDPPEFFSYLYMSEQYVDSIAHGNMVKEYVTLNYQEVCPESPHAEMIARMITNDNEEDEDEDDGEDIEEFDAEEAPVDKIVEKEQQSKDKDGVPPVTKGTGASKEVVQNLSILDKNKRKRDDDSGSIPENPKASNVEETEVINVEEEEDKDEPVYVTAPTLASILRPIVAKLNQIAARLEDNTRTQNEIKEQIGQKANQADTDPISRKERTDTLAKAMMKQKVPESAKEVVSMGPEDKKLIAVLSKPSVTESEMAEILEELKLRMMNTSKEVAFRTMTAKKLMSQMLRKRVIESLKEIPNMQKIEDIKVKGKMKVGDIPPDLQFMLSSLNPEKEDAAAEKADEGPAKKPKKK